GSITWRARMELARRRALQRVDPVAAVAFWYRPAMAAAAVIAVVSATLLFTNRAAQQPTQQQPTEVATGAYMSSTEVPVALASWYEQGNSPTAAELLVPSEESGNGSVR